jgi:short-subunit dehydrogenase
MSMPWKTAWIIGGSTGLGAEAVKQLDAQGIKTFVSARSTKGLDTLCNTLEHSTPLPLDITKRNEIDASINFIKRELSHLPDLIIINAAIYTPMGATDFDCTAITQMVNVNYLGAVNVFGALLSDRNFGKKVQIATVASPSGWRGLAGGVGYGPTKAALINLVEGLRAEIHASDFDLRIVNPGFIRTRLTDKNEFKMPQLMEADVAAGKMLKGLQSKAFDIQFPYPFIIILRLLRLLPDWLYFKLTQR